MSANHIEFDEARCVAAGLCAMVAPEVFDQRDDNGVAILLTENPTDEQLPGVQEAISLCPAAALRLAAP